VRPILPGALPVLQWLAQERGQDFDPEMLSIE
jgi:8-oxo-dGTP diphosphatase